MKKFILKLVGWHEQRANIPQMRTAEASKDKQKLESELAKERQDTNRENQWEEIPLPDAEHPEKK